MSHTNTGTNANAYTYIHVHKCTYMYLHRYPPISTHMHAHTHTIQKSYFSTFFLSPEAKWLLSISHGKLFSVESWTDTRLPQIPSWKDKRKPSLCPCSETELAKPLCGWGQGSEGVKISVPGNLAFSLKRLDLSVTRPLCARFVMVLRCAPFGQCCLISTLLSLSHCMKVSANFFPISFLKIVYKMLYFLISLLGIKHSFCKTSWSQTYFLIS